jgi:hypothetical protein
MSAFFEWDTGLVEKALREKLAQMDHSLIPDDYADGYGEWIGCEIDVPELVGKEFYTNAWDVSIDCDYEEGTFTVVAYPIVDDEEGRPYTETSAWITLADVQVVTVKVPVNDLEGDALDWAVTKAEGFDWAVWGDKNKWGNHGWATRWEMGGPIIERERISTQTTEDHWDADLTTYSGAFIQSVGDTPLVAAMRCYVASRLSDVVEVPEMLLTESEV